MKEARVFIRISNELKKEAKEVLEKKGITLSDFLRKCLEKEIENKK